MRQHDKLKCLHKQAILMPLTVGYA